MSDPLDAVLVSVDPMQLATWQEAGGESADSVETDEDQQTSSRDAPFPIDAGINSKLVLWSGDLANAEGHGHSCRTGEAKVTKGYRLPARFIIHTIGPRYNAKYRTAAESALYNSTRAVLEQVLDRGLDTLGLAPIHSIKRGYPPEEGAHLILRCLRRFLERHGDGLSRLVLATGDQNGACYPELAALYFPRRPAELRQSKIALAGANLGGLMGEPVHQGRGIRIAANPLGEQRDSSRESSPSPPPSEAAMGDQIETAVAATAGVLAGYGAEQDSGLAVSGVGSHAFARMEQNPDSDASRWQKRVGSSSGGGGGAGGVGK
uniref:Macro domain-containing protein n=1 Tax=Macrostomum lignano TaxID=282301 RepID=A0A1I8H5A4_9PLAT